MVLSYSPIFFLLSIILKNLNNNVIPIIIPSECIKEGQELTLEKVKPRNFQIDVGDTVLFILSDAMTKSIPPQGTAQAIQVNRDK